MSKDDVASDPYVNTSANIGSMNSLYPYDLPYVVTTIDSLSRSNLTHGASAAGNGIVQNVKNMRSLQYP